MNLNLAGKVALVTGGANGVGREIALTLAAEGAAVAVNYYRSGEAADAVVGEIAEQGGRAIACGADVADLAAVQAMVARVVGELGRLDILVNNAGVAIRRRFNETTPEEWRRQIDACLYGAIQCCHAAAPHLQAGGGGRIISLIGDSSRVGESGLAIVAAARAGVIGLVKSLAKEYGRFGVTANVISLGLVETDHDRDWVEANREALIRLYPLRRLGQPGDVAPLVALLASDRASWITGQVISVSGGFSMV
jgi:NAD(P)-dependent dehydrogenase (short-subunit alcohol dehydrogenase family)